MRYIDFFRTQLPRHNNIWQMMEFERFQQQNEDIYYLKKRIMIVQTF